MYFLIFSLLKKIFFLLRWVFVVAWGLLLLPSGMWDLSSLTKGQTHLPCIGKRIPTTRPLGKFLSFVFKVHSVVVWVEINGILQSKWGELIPEFC